MSLFQTIVGIDFGSHAIKAAWLTLQGHEVVVQRTEKLPMPRDEAEALRLIPPWIAKHELNKLPCVIALSGAQTVFQPGRLPASDPRTPAQAAAMEVATFNDLAGDQMQHEVADFTLTPERRYYLIAMARPAFIERVLQIAQEHELRVIDLVPAPVAVFNWHEYLADERERPRLHVHIGANQTEMAVGLPRGLLFARAVAMGGNAFTTAVAQARSVATPQAERLKVAEGSLKPGAALAEVLSPVAERLSSQIASGLAVYKSQFSEPEFAIDDIRFSGGGALLPGLADALCARLNLPEAKAKPRGGKAPKTEFDLALGLAATSLLPKSVYLSLLPQRLRNEVIFKVKKPYWVAAGIFGALTLGVFTVSGLRGLRRENEELRREGTELAQLEQAQRNIERQRRRAQQLRRNTGPLREILRSAPVTRELISLVARSIHQEDWISMICDERSYTQPPVERETARPTPRRLPGMREVGARRPSPPPTPRQTPAAPPMRVFIVEGYTPDPSLMSVKHLISRLRANRMVEKADLLGDDRVLSPSWFEGEPPATLTNLTHFVVRVELRNP